MKYDFEVCKFSTYLRINFSGSWTRKVGIRIITEIDEICQSNDCRHILFDIRNATIIEFSTMVDFFEAKCAANLFRGKPHKVVVLLTKCDFEKARWFETVGRNRGLQLSRFMNMIDATNWLSGKPKSS